MRSRSRSWPIVASRNFTLLILQRRLAWLACSSGSDRLQARASAAPPGKISGTVSMISPGGGCALPGLQPQITAGAGVAETAGADGLKIAETFPEGRGSPHGCGLRAVFCTDAASARPEACRDKSKGPRSGDFAGRSPGVQGAAATGRPLCAPGTMSDIAQKNMGSAICPEKAQEW